jgi:hypothetical protein
MAFVKMRDADGNYIMVNDGLANNVSNYEKDGYTTDLNKPLDYNKLGANSIYRDENKQYTKGAYVPQQQINRDGIVQTMGTVKPPTQPIQTATPQIDFAQQLADVRKTKELAGLKNAYDKNIGAISDQERLIKPAYEGQRSGLRANSTMQAKDFENFLANKGISASGSAGQGEISRNVTLQGGISASQLQQQNALEGMGRMKLDAKRDYESGVVSSSADIEAQLLKNKLEENQRMADIARADTRYQNDLDRQDEAIEYDRGQDSLNNEINTIGAYYNNFQAEIDKRKATPSKEDDVLIPYLQSARENKIKELDELERAIASATSTAEAKQIQQAFENKLKQDKLNYDIGKPYYAPKSGGGGTPSVAQQTADKEATAQQLSGDVMTYLDDWASGQAEDKAGQRADQSDMLNYLKSNSGTLTAQGVDVIALIKWVTENYTWIR